MAALPSTKISFGIIEPEEDCGGSCQGDIKQPTSTTTASTSNPQKKRRNLPGTPSKYLYEKQKKAWGFYAPKTEASSRLSLFFSFITAAVN
ncbi:hypothetical protein EJ110_NYTH07685 [Nymphaea thermarum]|nr:hypothetical protein EJ110_NYTH07685 [Nymphaea thermarum]